MAKTRPTDKKTRELRERQWQEYQKKVNTNTERDDNKPRRRKRLSREQEIYYLGREGYNINHGLTQTTMLRFPLMSAEEVGSFSNATFSFDYYELYNNEVKKKEYLKEKRSLIIEEKEKERQRETRTNEIKAQVFDFFGYYMYILLFAFVSIRMFYRTKHKSDTTNNTDNKLNIIILILNIACIIALVILGSKIPKWYYTIIIYVLGYLVATVLYFGIFRWILPPAKKNISIIYTVIALISTLTMYILLFNPAKDYNLAKNEYYICTGGYSTVYHTKINCKGLDNCKSDVIKVKNRLLEHYNKTKPCGYCIK